MRVVCPYRPFAPESQAHKLLGPFDWIGALRMAITSATAATGQPAYALTDVDTALPGPAIQVPTTQRRLMLWILDVCLSYLASPWFDRDTLMMSPDMVMFEDVPMCDGELGVLARLGPKFRDKRPLLNGIQWWRVGARDRLIAFYRRALAYAVELPDNRIAWGADTDPLVALLAPAPDCPGTYPRADLRVSFIDAPSVMSTIKTTDIDRLERGLPPAWPNAPVADFKYLRKQSMAAFYQATLGQRVPA